MSPATNFGEETGPEDGELMASVWRRGRRAALLGGAIALGLVLLVAIGLLLLQHLILDPRGDRATWTDIAPLLVQGLAAVVTGATVGFYAAGFRLNERLGAVGRMSTAAGAPSVGRELRRIVFRGATAADPVQQALASRYAALSAVALPYQALCFGSLYLALVLGQIPQLLRSPGDTGLDFRPFTIVLLVALVTLGAVFGPLMIRRGHRAAAYSNNHPFAAAVGPPEPSTPSPARSDAATLPETGPTPSRFTQDRNE